MKKIGLLIVMFISLVSCSNDDNSNKPTESYHGNWILTRMGISNPAANSIDVLKWQESYTFNSNNTFSKTRKRDGKITAISGTYSVVKTAEQTKFELVYAKESDIIGSCTSKTKENLYIINEIGSLYNTWNACDGPVLVYDKVK
ncbi:hypothetical protein [Flavobacterium sp. HBTb2-11-1]|uniref:hypothetical protein n=1 Tax=Flavobacterium sp. HBTb2-11-1 TaxID=2692212 RepID=UPI00136DDE18|nr:hypothetical protein [Flavobacterium sp. HBTb2-11-1]MXO04325.1 hypothetical protein [Flavobacterium sp. HBTb2-11-1]